MRYLTVILLFCVCFPLCTSAARKGETAKAKAPAAFSCLKDSLDVVHSATYAWYGLEQHTDEYLSALPYKGWTVGIGNESDKIIPFRTKNKEQRARNQEPGTSSWEPRTRIGSSNLRQYWHWEVGYGQLLSSAKSNRRRTWFAAADWRIMYEWQWKGLTIKGGGMVAADYAGRLAGSNINKPYSMDLSADLCAAAGVQYALWAGNKIHLTFDYQINTPVLGCFFAPDMGQAYYELYDGVKGTAYFSSFHNKQAFRQDFHIDLRLQRTAWRIGITHSYTKYHAGDLHFQREDMHAYVGWLTDLTIRRGTRKKS